MTRPTPEQSQAILSAAGERYVRGEAPFDLRLLITEEAWNAARVDARKQVEALAHWTAFSLNVWVNRADVLAALRGDS